MLLSKHPDLTVDEIKYLLFKSARKKLPNSGSRKCGETEETQFPNNMYGHGRINIEKAYKFLLKLLKGREVRKKEHNAELAKDKAKKKTKEESRSQETEEDSKGDEDEDDENTNEDEVIKKQENSQEGNDD